MIYSILKQQKEVDIKNTNILKKEKQTINSTKTGVLLPDLFQIHCGTSYT